MTHDNDEGNQAKGHANPPTSAPSLTQRPSETAADTPVISILLPTNRGLVQSMPMIGQLASLESQAVEIWLADNSGDPDKAALLAKLSAANRRFKVLQNERNLPAEKNYHSIVERASGKYSFICADDDYLDAHFLSEAVQLLAAGQGDVCIVPPIYEHRGQGLITPVQRIDEARAGTWVDRILNHLHAQIIPVLTYSVIPRPVLNTFFEYVAAHPLVGSFIDWNFEYFARAHCRCVNATGGFYLYDYQRWLNVQDAIESDARHYVTAGLPHWFVAFHRLYWAVDLCNFIDSRYFPSGARERKTVIDAVIARNVAVFRDELVSIKREMFQSVPVSAGLKQEIQRLIVKPAWSRTEVTELFARLLQEVSPEKASAYARFVADIQSETRQTSCAPLETAPVAATVDPVDRTSDEPRADPATYSNWKDALHTELEFWSTWLQTKGLQWPQDYTNRIDPTTELHPAIGQWFTGETVPKVLDVGAGPMTLLGKNWQGRRIELQACDALADEYNKLPFPEGLPLVRTQRCDSERLTERFEPNAYDIVHAQNTLDHSYAPDRALLEMATLVKPGGVIYLCHIAHEAEKENYEGLHQWSFELARGALWLYNRQRRISVNELLAASMEMVFSSGDGSDPCVTVFRKALAPAETKRPTVSVVIPCFRQAHLVGEALDSVRAQSFTELECIVVDDGSPDDTADVVERYIAAHPEFPLKLLRKPNGGLSDARNAGIAQARGDFILPLDSDDRLHPEMIERTLRALQQSGADIAYTDIQHFGDRDDLWETGPLTLADETQDNRIAYCSLYRRRVFDAVGGYCTDLNSYEDWDFWIGALEKGFQGVKVPGPWFHYRKSPTSMLVEANQRRPRLIAQIVLRHPTLYDAPSLQQARQLLGQPAASAQQAAPNTILIACDFYWPSVGGVETIAANLGEAMKALGHEVEIAARALPQRTSDLYRGMRIHSLDANSPGGTGLPPACRQLRELIESGRYSGVIMQADPLNWVIWSLDGARIPSHTRVLVQPLINEDGYAQWRGIPVFRRNLSHALRQASAVVCLTEQGPDARFMREENIPFAVLPNATTPLPTSLDFRAEYGFAAEKPLLLHVGNLWPVKNHVALIRAFKKLQSDCQLALLGNPTADRDYYHAVRAEAATDPRVRLLQGLAGEQVAAAMEAADLVLLASLGEVFPVTLIEAMSHARAWIATPECGAANELSGGIIAPLTEFPAVIGRLLDDPDLRRKLGELGRAHGQACNDWPTVAAAWKQLVETGRQAARLVPPWEVWAETLRVREEMLPGSTASLRAAEAADASAQVQSATPLVSVIVPTYNRPNYLHRALASLAAQTYRNFEVLVINDHGCDVSEVTQSFEGPLNLQLLNHDVNRGMSAARNTALKQAQGELLAYLDDDDRFLPDHLETLVAAFRDPSVMFAYTDSEYVAEREGDGTWTELGRYRPFDGLDFSRERLHYRNYIPINTWGHRRRCVDELGAFDESLKIYEDWDFLLRIARRYDRIVHIQRITVEVHTRDQADNTLRREQTRSLETCRVLYSRYDDLGHPEIVQGRREILGESQACTLPQGNSGDASPVEIFRMWQERHRLLSYGELDTDEPPSFQLLVVAPRERNEQLADTLDAVGGLHLQTWQLAVFSDGPAPNALFDELEILEWQQLAGPSQLPAALNATAAASSADWIVLVPCGASPAAELPTAIARHAVLHPEVGLWYFDSEIVDEHAPEPQFRPNFNLDLLRSMHYMGDLVAIRREFWTAVGGLARVDSAGINDLIFRVLDRFGEAAIGHVDDLLYRIPRSELVPIDEDAARQALSEHLTRAGVTGLLSAGLQPGCRRVTYVQKQDPRISIIIATRDQTELLRSCVDIILSKTTYTDYEILIVDNQSKTPEMAALLASFEAHESGRFRLLKYPRPFNHSAIRNLAAKAASGDYLLFLDDDTQVLQPEWLFLLVYAAQRPELGIIGPRLVYPGSARLQHAGVLLGLGGVAEHPYLGLLGLADPGYMNRAVVDQNLQAVCGSCFMVRRSVFEEAGGMDESNFRNPLSMIDFCLRVRELGYKILWTPHVTLIHHSSATKNAEGALPAKAREMQEQLEGEFHRMLDRRLPQIANDPSYNRHLSLLHRDYRVDCDFVVNWNPALPSPRQRILAWTLDGAPCEYRINLPTAALEQAGIAEVSTIHPPGRGLVRTLLLSEIARARPDVFTTSVFLGLQDHLDMLKQIRRHTGIPIVMQLDDFVTAVPKGSEAYKQRHTPGHLKKILEQADRVICSTQPIADFVQGLCGDIRLVPNYLPRAVWDGLTSRRRGGSKPRVGWAGAMQHGGDLAMMTEVVRATAGEVDWVFFGMCPENLSPYVREFHPFVMFDQYPATLASLDLDLAIAPLESNRFNEGKSNLRLLEYGFLGWPVVCSDVLPYRSAPVTRVTNRPNDWIEAIRSHLADPDASAEAGVALQRWVLSQWMLEDHVERWAEAFRFGAPERTASRADERGLKLAGAL